MPDASTLAAGGTASPPQATPAAVSGRAPQRRWLLDTDAGKLTTPLVSAQGSVYVSSSRAVLALDLEGRVRWSRTLGAIDAGPLALPSGSLLVLSGGRLLVLSAAGEIRRVRVQARLTGTPLALADGTLVATSTDQRLLFIRASPDPVGSFVWGAPELPQAGPWSLTLLSADSILAAHPAGTLLRVSREGVLSKLPQLPQRMSAGPWVAGDTVWLATRDRQLWTLRDSRLRPVVSRAQATGEAAVGRDGALRLPTRPRSLVCLGEDGAERWRLTADASFGGVRLDRNDVALAVSALGDLYAVNAAGRVLWKVRSALRWATRPALAPDGTIVLGSRSGRVEAWR